MKGLTRRRPAGGDSLPSPGILAAFESPEFRWVWLSVLAANSGRFCVVLVAGYEAYRVGHSATWSGSIMMVTLLPIIVVAPIAGGLADRRNRAVVMGCGMGTATAACLLLTVVTLAGIASLPLLIGLVLVIGVGLAVQLPAWQAVLPGLLGPHRLLNGSMLAQIAQQGAQLTGPAIGTAVLVFAGTAPAFGLCTAFYLLGALAALRVRRAVPAPQGTHRGLFTPVLHGFAYLARHATLRLLILFVALHCALTMAFNGILPELAQEHLGGGGSVYGLLLTSVGLGAVGGPLLLVVFGRRLRDVHVLFGSGLLSGALLAALGIATSLPVAGVLAFGTGAAQAVFMAVFLALSQTLTAEPMRGRVSSAQVVITAGSMSLLSMGWGMLAGPWGPALTMLVPGLAFAAVVVGFLPSAARFDVRGAEPAVGVPPA